MASKSKQGRQGQIKADKSRGIYIAVIPALAFLIKLVVMAKIVPTFNFGGALQHGGWLGADGENYLNGTAAILTQGFSSADHLLSYWPAGYPILIWGITKISATNTIVILSLSQSIFYAFASYYFSKKLMKTKVREYSIFIALLLAFNPTLSLSTLVVGYESPVAACMLMVIGLIVASREVLFGVRLLPYLIGTGFFLALASFMQPRWVLTSIVIAIIWALTFNSWKSRALVLAAVVGITAVAPLALIVRNDAAGNGKVVSTNIVAALQYGTGPETSGGYMHTGPNIDCKASKANSNPTDSEFIACAAKWYLTNPIKTAKLSWNKSVYFWSPWYGPEVNGTMARNPWVKINPLRDLATKSQQGHDLVYGAFGKVCSWLWLISGVVFLFIGYRVIRRLGAEEKILANLLMAPIAASWLAAIATLGDHRFRIPTMSLSLALQGVALIYLKKKMPK
jgi:hypothetical protein